MKSLILLRGLPGCGKTELANLLFPWHHSADMYFEGPNGEYWFNPEELSDAHESCQRTVEHAMNTHKREVIAVANTFTEDWEMDFYYKLADKYDYRVFTVVVENRHGHKNSHNVPDEIVEEMRGRFSVKL